MLFRSQALYDFNKIIETNPDNGSAYLSRASVYERIGDYPAAIEDYQQYQAKNTWDCTTEFTVGFTKGLASGVKDAGVEFGGFIADCVTHPIDTSANIWKSCTLLKDLVVTSNWDAISQILSPDAHKLITNWDALSMEERGELAGHAFGKHGGDFLIPGTTSKVVSAGLSEVKQLGKVCKTLKNAEKSVLLEGLIEGTIATEKKQGLIGKGRNFFGGNPELQASFDRFQKAEKFLQNYKEFMTEAQAHELIRKVGINTFARPIGIPENFRVKITNYGAGIKYIHPSNEQTYIRVMPGKPHSRNPTQQKPYITWMKNGETLDKNGNVVNKKSIEAHIPIQDFKYVR